MTVQVADTTQPRMAVKKMTRGGGKVTFYEEGSGALNGITKEWIPMEGRDVA